MSAPRHAEDELQELAHDGMAAEAEAREKLAQAQTFLAQGSVVLARANAESAVGSLKRLLGTKREIRRICHYYGLTAADFTEEKKDAPGGA